MYAIPTPLVGATIIVGLIPQAPAAGWPRLWNSIGGKVRPKAGLTAASIAMIASVIAAEGGYVNVQRRRGADMGITKKVAVANGYAGSMRTLPRGVGEGIYDDPYPVMPAYAALIPIDATVTEELLGKCSAVEA